MFHSIEGKTSGWLSALPLSYHHFDLPAVEFHDLGTIDLFRECLQTVMDVAVRLHSGMLLTVGREDWPLNAIMRSEML